MSFDDEDNESYEDKIAARDTKYDCEFFGIRFTATAEQWNAIYMDTITSPEWVKLMAYEEIAGRVNLQFAAPGSQDFERQCSLYEGAYMQYVLLAKRVHARVRKSIGGC